MKGISPVLFFTISFFLSVWAEEGPFAGRKKAIARTPQGLDGAVGPSEPTIQPESPRPRKEPDQLTATLPSTIPSLVTSTTTNEVTVIFTKISVSLPTSVPSQRASSIPGTFTQTDASSQTVPLNSASIPSPTIMSQNLDNIMETSSSSSASAPHRTLVIVLSTILGSIGIILVVLVFFLACRFRKRKAFKRGVSPINDDEIESWRNKERKQALASPPRGLIGTVSGGRISPDWTWMSPGNVQSPPRAITRGPSLLAKAPNARVGLTTEIVPGEAPFIPIVKRQSSRLSKSQPSHIRTKSMRSSTSARSMRSMNGGSVGVIDFTMSAEGVPSWHNSEDRRVESHAFSGLGTSSPATSVYVGPHEGGGLSPRPKSRQWEKSPEQQTTDVPPGWPISWN